MRSRIDNEEPLVRYLLGELTEEERLRLEAQFFTDDELFEQLVALEEELMFDYAQGRLRERERELFEKRFLATAEGRAKLDVAVAITDRLAARANAKPAAEQTSFWRKFVSLIRIQNPTYQFGLALAMLLALGGFVWLTIETNRLREQLNDLQTAKDSQTRELAEQAGRGRERAQELTARLEHERNERERLGRELDKQKSQAEERGVLAGVLSFVLSPGAVREEGDMKRLAIPAGARTLRLQLDLKGTLEYRSYRATLLTAEGDERWSQDGLRASPSAAGQAVFLKVLADLLPEGDYELVLRGLSHERRFEEVATYYFSVVKK